MKKLKFRITDEQDQIYEVEETERVDDCDGTCNDELPEFEEADVEEKEVEEAPAKEKAEEESAEEETTEAAPEDAKSEDEDAELTKDEIKALKALAAKAEELLALIEVEHEEHGVDKFDEESKDEEEDVMNEEDENGAEDEVLEDSAEMLDEDVEDVELHDSRSSFGSIESAAAEEDIEESDDIANAWKKYYSGGRN